jgi:hypothetical protein
MLRPLQSGLKQVLKSAGLRNFSPSAYFHSTRYIDSTLLSVKLDKVRGKTLGFGPFSFFNRTYISGATGKALNATLQRLADRNIPAMRSLGKHYIVLSRKSAAPPQRVLH